MRTTVLAALALGACLLVQPVSSAVAQSDDAAPPSPSQHSIDLVFDGGTLGELVEQLEKSAPTVNIIMDERSRSFGVPALAVRRTSVTLLLEALEELALPPTPLDQLIIRSHRSKMVIQHGGGARQAGQPTAIPEPVHTIIARRLDGSRDAATVSGEPIRTHVISLARIVETTGGADESLGAVEMVLETAGDDAAAIRYHEPTRTLVVRGPVSTIAAVTEVIASLEEGADWSEQARRERDDMEQLMAEVKRRRADAEHLVRMEEEREVMQVELQSMRARMEAIVADGRARMIELEDVRNGQQRRIEELEIELVRATSMLEQMEQDRARLQSELERVRGPRGGGRE